MFSFLIFFGYSIQVTLNDKLYEGESIQSIITDSGLSDDQINKINIISGTFQFNGFQASKYTNLGEFIINEGCFNGAVDNSIFQNSQSLSKITILGDITLQLEPFLGCTNLKVVEFNSVTNLLKNHFMDIKIESIALYNQEKLEVDSITDFPSLQTLILPNCKQIELFNINNCPNLVNISFPSLKILKSNTMNNLPRLRIIDLPELQQIEKGSFINSQNVEIFKADKVKYIFSDLLFLELVEASLKELINMNTNIFAFCIKLEKLYIGEKFDSTNRISFFNCFNLKYMRLDYEANIYGSFLPNSTNLETLILKNCVNFFVYESYPCLKTLIMPKCENIQEQLITDAKNLSTLVINIMNFSKTLENFENLTFVNLSNIISISKNFFKNCVKLEELYLPNALSIAANSLDHCYNLRVISFDSVVTLYYGLFEDCTNLETVFLPNLRTIPNYAFLHQRKLKTIDVTSASIVEKECFRGCISLEEINLDSVQQIKASAFDHCTNLKKVSLKKLIILSYGVFSNCQSLESINLHKADEAPERLFENCLKLRVVNFDYCKHVKLFAFANTNISYLNLPNCETISEYAFQNCKNLVSFTANKARSIGQFAFDNCLSLQTVFMFGLEKVPSYLFFDNSLIVSLKFVNLTEIGDFSFFACKSLKKIEMPNVIKIGKNAFESCTSLEEISCEKLTKIEKTIFKNCLSLSGIYMNSLTIMEDDSFNDLPKLVELQLDSLSEIKRNCFKNCINLETLILPKLTKISENFCFRCYKLKFVNLGSITDISLLDFTNRKFLKLVILNNILEIPNKFFFNCPSLKTIVANKVTKINSNSFAFCNGLEVINFPCLEYLDQNAFYNVKSIKKVFLPRIKTINFDHFSKCKITSFVIPNCEEIDQKLLVNCEYLVLGISTTKTFKFNFENNLSFISLPNCVHLFENTFSNCNKLERVELPNVKQIFGDFQFENCINLKIINLTSLEIVDENSHNIFYNCNSLETLCLASQPPNKFNKNITFEKIKIILPKTSDWTNYINQSVINSNNHYEWHGYDTNITHTEDNNDDPKHKKKILIITLVSSISGLILISVIIIIIIVLKKKNRKHKINNLSSDFNISLL